MLDRAMLERWIQLRSIVWPGVNKTQNAQAKGFLPKQQIYDVQKDIFIFLFKLILLLSYVRLC